MTRDAGYAPDYRMRDKEPDAGYADHHAHDKDVGADVGGLAKGYVVWQKWRNLYDVEEGFSRGTIFEELDLPFRGYERKWQ